MSQKTISPDESISEISEKRSWKQWWEYAKCPALNAVVALLLVLATLDPNGSWGAKAFEAPGVTIDESFNVQQGYYLWEVIKGYNLGLLHPDSIQEAFGPESSYLADHPPLARFWMGITQSFFGEMFTEAANDDSLFNLPAARLGSGIAFALTVFIVGLATSFWYGRIAGVIASISILLMPRLFAHAHFASLESGLNLAYVGAILIVAKTWTKHETPTFMVAAFSGIFLGLTLLTKIQGVFLPFPLAAWALWHWRHRAIVPILIWGLMGVFTFFVCWPWLWLDPMEHLMGYLGRTTDRVTLYCWYFGDRYADKQTPWHFPLIMFLTTVPIGFHVLGFSTFFQKSNSVLKDKRSQLLLANIVFPLILFALPVATYDGTRLFLMVFPVWAIFIGIGGQAAWHWAEDKWSSRNAQILCLLFFLAPAWVLYRTHPTQIAYHNLLLGGQRGAAVLGMERDYWASSLTHEFLTQVVTAVPEGEKIGIFPTLHQFQIGDVFKENSVIRNSGRELVAWNFETHPTDYVIVYYRLADLSEEFKVQLETSKPLVMMERGGVMLAGLYRLKKE